MELLLITLPNFIAANGRLSHVNVGHAAAERRRRPGLGTHMDYLGRFRTTWYSINSRISLRPFFARYFTRMRSPRFVTL